ncbi:MAG: ABC transporter substrate-binding protein [Rhodocyclaceae bacterium]|nr:ABC transporter substrate-binding protein [Rhodocyclaceae bacterium]MBX3675990.1 ABC transporter substrate-binding protein [Rhodocyclaceae bacterium]MCB1893372.1 ABC transporter substrate-binding protein [Rhodocyclaceae bacterium]MCW5596883.1 ABC transporter substrate-binding protein [Rhodocyclaceae bacterium]
MKWKLIHAFAAALLVAGCGHPETELRVGASPWSGNAPFILAADDGRLGDAVRLVEFTSETAILQAFRNRALDVAILTLDEAVLLASEGHAVRIAALTDISVGAGQILARSPQAGVKDLKGRRVAVESTGVGAFILAHALHQAGMAVGDVDIVDLLPHEQLGEYEVGRIDAAVSHEPYAGRLRALGARPVFDTSQMSEDLIRAVVVRDTCLQDHPGRLSDLVRALRASRAPFASEAALARAARRYDQTPAQFAQAYAGLRPLGEEENAAFFADGARKLRGVLTHIHDEMLKARLIVAPVDLAQLPMQAVP